MLKEIKTKKEFNKLVRNQRKTGEEIKILFHSLWCPVCQDLVDEAVKSPEEIYLVNTFDTPEATKQFGVTKVPSLLSVKGAKGNMKVYKEDYPAMIYSVLSL